MSIILGDLHFKGWSHDKVYFEGLKKLCNWIAYEFEGQVLILSGDVLNSSSEPWWVREALEDFILKFPKVHILQGNHEYSRLKGSALLTLGKHQNCYVYFEPTEVEIENTKFLMIPYNYDPRVMDDYASIKTKADVCVAHLAPPGTNRGVDEVDLTGIQCKYFFYGHIHIPVKVKGRAGQEHLILGVPQPTREKEQHFQPSLVNWFGPEEGYCSIDLPQFMTIETVEFDEEPVSHDNLLNVVNAPTIRAVETRYPSSQYYIRKDGIELLRTEARPGQPDFEDHPEHRKLEDKFRDFAAEKGKSQEMVDVTIPYLEKVSS